MTAQEHIEAIRAARAADRHPMTTAEIQAGIKAGQDRITAAASRLSDGGMAGRRHPWLE